jgi:YegS/Rv2252/BmrU family lipid kinase
VPSEREQSIREILQAESLYAEIFLVQGGDPAEAARQALEQGARIVIAAGGDGTVSAVASAVVNSDASLGVLPIGTLNHFAKDMQIPLDLREAIRVIARGKVARVDVGEVNGRIFINNSSLGLYPRIAMWREQQRRMGRNRWVAFFWAFVTALRRMPFLQLRLKAGDKEITRSTPLIFIGNNAYELQGVKAGTRRSLNAGVLFVCVVNAGSAMELIRLTLRVLFGRIQQLKEFDTLCVQEARVKTRRKQVKVSIDGEVTSMEAPLHYRTHPGALRVLVP